MKIQAAGIVGVLAAAFVAITVHDSNVRKEALADARREALFTAVKVSEARKDSLLKLIQVNKEKDKQLAQQDSKLRQQAQKLVTVQQGLEDSIASQKTLLATINCEPAKELVNSYDELVITLKERIRNSELRYQNLEFRYNAEIENNKWRDEVIASQDTIVKGLTKELKRKSHSFANKVLNTLVKVGIGYGIAKATE